MNKIQVGHQVGPYRLTRLLGAGGFGEVYEADHQLLQQKRAIKLLLERHFHDPNQRERFLREARTLATLDHPNILPVLEVGEVGTLLYLVMPFYRRGTLNDLLKQHTTPLPLAEVERALAQMCAAVGYAHARHIAHLDLKPENMLLHEDGRLVLSDFGLAHLIKQGRLEAGSSASWGTPYYMAPEQIRGEPELRSDVYALGIILYQLLTNQRPFTGPTPEAVMMKHLLEAPPPLRAASPTAPATLEPVIQKVLGKKPEDRYATAEALLADFRAAVSNPSSRPAQPPAPGASPAAPMPQVNIPTPVVQTTIPVVPERAPHAAEPVNITKATAAGCEIELKNGHTCGVQAIGRCATCGRTFCPTHQGWNDGTFGGSSRQGPYVDMCSPCFAVKKAEVDKRRREALAPYLYFDSGAARTALLTAGVPPVDIYDVGKRWEWRPGLFGLGGRSVEVATARPFGHGWILGEFRWGYNDGGPYGGTNVVRNWLTALMDLSPGDELYSRIGNYHGLVRVRPYSGGYEALSLGRNDRFVGDKSRDQVWRKEFHDCSSEWHLGEAWIGVAQAVKRLTGSSSLFTLH